jgi:hypothetical protein
MRVDDLTVRAEKLPVCRLLISSRPFERAVFLFAVLAFFSAYQTC